MVADLLKDSVTRSLVAAFVSEDQVEAMVRPVFERSGFSSAEIETLVAQTRANVRTWKAAAGVDVRGLADAAASGLLHALGSRRATRSTNSPGASTRSPESRLRRGSADARPSRASGARS